MDRYLCAIKSEERKLGILNERKNALIDTNRKKQQVIDKCDADEKSLLSQQDDNLSRKDYLENKKSYLKEFFKSSLKFGLKSSLWFLVGIVLISLLDYSLSSSIQPNVLDVLFGNSVIVALLGSVEFYNVSRDFRRLITGYNGNIDDDIEETYKQINLVRKRRCKVKEEMKDNSNLLSEVEIAIKEIQAKILEYRTDRNNLIESLVENLDVHIRDFEYQESDIHKVLEKVIQ